MDTVVAYNLIGGDEYGYMYDSIDIRPDICSICKNRIKDVPDPYYKVKKKGTYVTTYDHYDIVSEQFRKFCIENNYQNLRFTELVRSKGYYVLEVGEVVYLDEVRGHIEFVNHRDCCGSYDEIICPPLYVSKDRNPPLPKDFIARSYYRYGSFNRKSPVLLVGVETKRKMKEYPLKGLYFRKLFL